MSCGKVIRAYGKSDLDVSSDVALIEDFAHRLKVNIHAYWYRGYKYNIAPKVFDYRYHRTVELSVYIDEKSGRIYQYYFSDDRLKYLKMYPSGLFSCEVGYCNSWRLMLEDIESKFKYYNNRNEYLEIRAQLKVYCTNLGCSEVLLLSDFDSEVMEDLEYGRSENYPVKDIGELIDKLKVVEHKLLLDFAPLVNPDANFNWEYDTETRLMFYDNFK